jgi:hypothetical protein
MNPADVQCENMEKLKEGHKPVGMGERDDWGNSIDALRANLKLTYEERLKKAERGARLIRKYKGLIYRRESD